MSEPDDSSSLSSSISTAISKEISLSLEEMQGALSDKLTEYSAALDECSNILRSDPEYEALNEDLEALIYNNIRMLNVFIAELKEKVEPEESSYECALVYMEVLQALTLNMKATKANLLETQSELGNAENEMASMEKELEKLKSIMEKRDVTGEMKQAEELEKMSRMVNRIFKEHKEKLHEVIAELYPHKTEKVRELLGLLVADYFSTESDGYIEIEESVDYTVIELLLDGNIIKRHPYDIKKFKLDKL